MRNALGEAPARNADASRTKCRPHPRRRHSIAGRHLHSGVANPPVDHQLGPMPKSTLKRLPPKKRPRKAKAGTRGAEAAETLLPELTGVAAETRAAVER